MRRFLIIDLTEYKGDQQQNVDDTPYIKTQNKHDYMADFINALECFIIKN